VTSKTGPQIREAQRRAMGNNIIHRRQRRHHNKLTHCIFCSDSGSSRAPTTPASFNICYSIIYSFLCYIAGTIHCILDCFAQIVVALELPCLLYHCNHNAHNGTCYSMSMTYNSTPAAHFNICY